MSTPRPAKSESNAAPPPIFCWTFPGAPIRINLPLALIARLRADLSERESSDQGMPSVEAGGLLLGQRVTLTTLEIDDYRWLSSEAQPGSPYSLDTSALKRLREEYSARDGNTLRSQVVGYFRTQVEENLHLRDEEISLVREQFHDPTDVVLLIRTSDEQYTSGFHFWMRHGDFAPFSFKDFPLDAALLQAQAIESLATQAAQEEETTLPPATDQGPVRFSPRMTVTVAAVAAASLALAGLSAFLFRDRSSSGSKQKAVAIVAALPLQLDVEAQGDGLNVRWNPQSAAVTGAREGRLDILEGDGRAPRVIPLDLQQLRSGHIYYRSSAERVQFLLEIVDSSAGISIGSALAVSSPPAPVVTSTAPPQVGNVQSPNRKVESIPVPRANADALQLVNAAQAPLDRRPAPRTFTLPPSIRDRAAEVPAIAFDQPPAISTNTALPPTLGLPAPLNNSPAINTPSRYTGSWAFVPDVSRFHGLMPVYFNVFVLEERGRLFGTVNARFIVSGNADPGMRFDFTGPLQAARYQAFPLQTADGAKGRLELIPGNALNLLEVNYALDGALGKVSESDVILVKR